MNEKQKAIKETAKYYKIYGYDSNLDLGGNHTKPLLCIVRAYDKAQAIEYAETLPRYKCDWHGKGYVEEIKVKDLTLANSEEAAE